MIKVGWRGGGSWWAWKGDPFCWLATPSSHKLDYFFVVLSLSCNFLINGALGAQVIIRWTLLTIWLLHPPGGWRETWKSFQQAGRIEKCVLFDSSFSRLWVNALTIFPSSHVNHLVRWGINYTATDPQPLPLLPVFLFSFISLPNKNLIPLYIYTRMSSRERGWEQCPLHFGVFVFLLIQKEKEVSKNFYFLVDF